MFDFDFGFDFGQRSGTARYTNVGANLLKTDFQKAVTKTYI